MGWRAADGIADTGVDCQVEVRAIRTERIATANAQFIAALPPAMLAYDDARIELVTEARPRPHSAGRVRISSQSPFLMPRAAAVAGFSSISGSKARLRRAGSARCLV